MAREKELKQRFHEAFKESRANGNSNEVYTPKMLSALRDMAKANVYPDGSFGDMDCNIWSMFRI